MEFIFRICLFITGIINLLPSLLAFMPHRFGSSYGIEIPDINYELLMRHRAILFGIIGGIMIYAAISKSTYSLAVLIGFISMGSFIILLKAIGGEMNTELIKVMNVDIVGIIVLSIGYGLYQYSQLT